MVTFSRANDSGSRIGEFEFITIESKTTTTNKVEFLQRSTLYFPLEEGKSLQQVLSDTDMLRPTLTQVLRHYFCNAAGTLLPKSQGGKGGSPYNFSICVITN